MNVIELLQQKQGLTDTQASIADYILQHMDDVTEMTIGTLGQAAHCSNSAIVQLCRKLGLDGYRSLRIELARQIERQRMQAFEVNPDRPFIEDNSTRDIANSIATLSKQALDATYANLSAGGVSKAANMLLGARRVVYYAMGDSMASVEAFSMLLLKIGVVCTPGSIKNDYTAVWQFLDSRDVALIVSYSGVIFDEFEHLLEFLREKSVRCIVVTANRSAVEKLMPSDCALILPQGETRKVRLASFYSQECTRYLLNCIYAEAFSQNYQRNVDAWERLVQFDDEE